jgi:probable phosphoglycerate mutase
VQPQLEPRLQELNVGTWSGLTVEEITERYPEQFQAWQAYREVRPGGGETFGEMRQRAVAALEEIIAAHPGQTVCMVTHSGIVYALRGHALGLDLGAALFQGLPPNRNTAITTLHFQDGGAEVQLVMDASHLDGVADS